MDRNQDRKYREGLDKTGGRHSERHLPPRWFWGHSVVPGGPVGPGDQACSGGIKDPQAYLSPAWPVAGAKRPSHPWGYVSCCLLAPETPREEPSAWTSPSALHRQGSSAVACGHPGSVTPAPLRPCQPTPGSLLVGDEPHPCGWAQSSPHTGHG